MLFVFLLLFWAAGTKGPWKVSFFPFNMTVEGGLPRPTGGNNVSDQYHSDRSLYENSDYPPRRHPSREAEHTHGGRRAALRQSHAPPSPPGPPGARTAVLHPGHSAAGVPVYGGHSVLLCRRVYQNGDLPHGRPEPGRLHPGAKQRDVLHRPGHRGGQGAGHPPQRHQLHLGGL